ncbi:flavin reductase family protein [Oricola nitratireducens]|uniref:flavin reductase family protein n=1 Tax=Oricola nitratireducens TaxID=2775868 RepID=UPI001867A0E1|nr:flavin reductase family protein [Oricola nitratireducens]
MSMVDARELRNACGLFGTGVNIITTRRNGIDHGMTANAFMSVSLDPPLIAISIAEKAKMLPLIRETGRFAVSTLAHGMEKIAWHFAGKPDPGFQDVFRDERDLPVVEDALAIFVADVTDEILAGDHTIFIGHVRALNICPDREPLLFFKGKFGAIASQEPAPVDLCDPIREIIW